MTAPRRAAACRWARTAGRALSSRALSGRALSGRAFSIRRAAAAAALVSMLAAGCGSTPAATGSPARSRTSARPSLVTSLTVAGGTSWAVVEMGGSSASHDNFWQLVTRPAGATRWALATPPGVADNGGLVAAPLGGQAPGGQAPGRHAPGGHAAGGQALIAGFNPSQDLTFSPLATTADGGKRWAPGLLPAGLASVPSALAAGPGGKLIALTNRGEAELSAPGGTGWTRLASVASLAATPAGRSCGLTGLTAAGFGASGAPLLAGQCARAGVAGVFAYAAGRWRLAGPTLPAALAHRRVSVLQLTSDGRGAVALLTAAAPGGSVSLTAGWASATGRWALSSQLPLGGAGILSTATGAAGGEPSALATSAVSSGLASAAGVVLSTGRAEFVTAGAGHWQQLPALPAHAAALVLGPGRQISALAPSGSILTSWRLAARSGAHAVAWTSTQVMKVPVPIGSSS